MTKGIFVFQIFNYYLRYSKNSHLFTSNSKECTNILSKVIYLIGNAVVFNKNCSTIYCKDSVILISYCRYIIDNCYEVINRLKIDRLNVFEFSYYYYLLTNFPYLFVSNVKIILNTLIVYTQIRIYFQ